MIRYAFLISILLNTSKLTCQEITFENTKEVLDTLPINSIVIVVGDVSCGSCFQKLNDIIGKLNSNHKIFVYYDSQILPIYNRRAKEIEIRKQLHSFKMEIVFLPKDSDKLLTTQYDNCNGLESPYILIYNSMHQSNVFCHKDIFNANKTNRQLRIELKKMLL
jgi:hypothetical protein